MYIFHINMTKWYTNSNFLSEFRNSKSNGFYLFETFRNADKTHSKRNNNLRQQRLESNSIFPLTDRLRNSRECRPHTAGAYLDMSPILPPMFPRHSLDVPSMFLRLNSAQKPVSRDTKMQLHRQQITHRYTAGVLWKAVIAFVSSRTPTCLRHPTSKILQGNAVHKQPFPQKNNNYVIPFLVA